MLYGLDMVALTKGEEAELEVAELKMSRFSMDVTAMGGIRNEHVGVTAKVGKVGDRARDARLRWFENFGRRGTGKKLVEG